MNVCDSCPRHQPSLTHQPPAEGHSGCFWSYLLLLQEVNDSSLNVGASVPTSWSPTLEWLGPGPADGKVTLRHPTAPVQVRQGPRETVCLLTALPAPGVISSVILANLMGSETNISLVFRIWLL